MRSQEASLNGAVLSLPVVVVGQQFYQIDLTLVPNTEPLEFSLSGGTEIFGASNIGASTLVGATLSIPLLRVGQVSYFLELSLISDSPVKFKLSNAGIVTPESAEIQQAREIFGSTVSPSIVQNRCIVCHITGGLSGHTRFVLTAGNDQVDANFGVLSEFLANINGGGDLLLDKARGVSHGGGVQLAGDSIGFQNFDQFLSLLGKKSVSESVSVGSFFDAVILLSRQDTLRKATELLQGRLATPDELSAVEAGGEDGLKAALFELMNGEVFKDFIRINANDILLTMGAQDISDAFRADRFIDSWDISLQVFLETGDESLVTQTKDHIVSNYVRRQPLELINYVVENERPYTEILTADYVMVNPYTNRTYKAGAEFIDPKNLEEWQPGTINNYVLLNDKTVYKPSEHPFLMGFQVPVSGDLLDYPHAGILNTPAFLTRYPSTATNRNRARARWAYKFFLGVDIEASAPRTTDPVALADTNNPTLNNPNCTVCHEIHDPVAGAFQDYGHDWGWYKENGGDSLDNVYKFPEDGSTSLYEHGDTWYRDMRSPGFNGNTPAIGENSLKWLAQEITGDPRFATASVQFWWKAIFGTKPLLIPEVETDADFQERLTAFEVENSLINGLADGFRTGFTDHGPYNLKDLLVEMIMSPRFRAGNLEGFSEADRNAYVGVGPGRILTAEMMQAKIESVLGIKWVQYYDAERDNEILYLTTDYLYHFLYGGIDSFAITERPEDYSTIMRSIIELLGLQGSGVILGNDLIKERASRTLFPFVEMNTNPNRVFRQSVELTGDGVDAKVVKSSTTTFTPGGKILSINFTNQFIQNGEAGEFNRLYLERLVVRDSQNNLVLDVDMGMLFDTPGIEVPCGSFGPGGQQANNYWGLDACEMKIPVTIPKTGEYTISVTAWPRQYGPENLIYTLGADATGDMKESLAVGAQAIKQNIQLLVNRLWNKDWGIDHTEIQIAYELWVELYAQGLSYKDANPDTWFNFISTQANAELSRGFSWEDWQALNTPEKSYLDDFNNHQQIMAWRGLMSYLVSDFEFIYQ